MFSLRQSLSAALIAGLYRDLPTLASPLLACPALFHFLYPLVLVLVDLASSEIPVQEDRRARTKNPCFPVCSAAPEL